MRRFPALSCSGSESDSLAFFPTRLRLLVWSHEEAVLEEAEEVLAEVVVGVQCCLGEGRAVRMVLRAVMELDVRRRGNDRRGCDMADLKMDSSRRTKMIQLNHHDLSHKHAFTFVRACEQTACTSCTLWMCILCTGSGAASSAASSEPHPEPARGSGAPPKHQRTVLVVVGFPYDTERET